MRILLSFVLLFGLSGSAFGGIRDWCNNLFEDLNDPGGRRHRELDEQDAKARRQRQKNEEDQYRVQKRRGGSEYEDERMEKRIRDRGDDE